MHTTISGSRLFLFWILIFSLFVAVGLSAQNHSTPVHVHPAPQHHCETTVSPAPVRDCVPVVSDTPAAGLAPALALEVVLKTAATRVADNLVPLYVAYDVVRNGNVVIPAGTPALASIVNRYTQDKRSILQLDNLSIRLPDGTRHALWTDESLLVGRSDHRGVLLADTKYLVTKLSVATPAPL